MSGLDEQMAYLVAEGVFDGIPIPALMSSVYDIHWSPAAGETVDRLLRVAGAMLDLGFVMTEGPYGMPINRPWHETTRAAVLGRLRREYLALTAEPTFADIGWFVVPRGGGTLDAELQALLAAAEKGDVSCVPIFIAAARLTLWGERIDAARQLLMAAMIEVGFVAVEGPGSLLPGLRWRETTPAAVVERFERQFAVSMDGATLLDCCWFHHPARAQVGGRSCQTGGTPPMP